MTQSEMIEMIHKKSRSELLPLLYQVEQVMKIFYPLARRSAELEYDIKAAQEEWKHLSENYTGGCKVRKFSFVFTAILAALAFLILDEGLLKLLCTFAFFFALLFTAVTCFIVVPGYKRDQATKEVSIQQMTVERNQIEQQLTQVEQQYNDTIVLCKLMCPKECYDPQYLRVYINYFETGRADTIKEAWAIWEEQLHRQSMTDLANKQIAASKAAQYAAEDAKAAAVAASNAADTAARQARQASYDVRFHD